MAARFSKPGMWGEGFAVPTVASPRWTGKVALVPKALELPLHWRKPARVFVSATSDLFHEVISNEDIAAIFGVMASTPRHTYQVLTKRPARMLEWFKWLEDRGRAAGEVFPSDGVGWRMLQCLRAITLRHFPCDIGEAWPLPNVHLGVSIEDQATADERIPLLLQAPAALCWVSAEPLLGPVKLDGLVKGHCPVHDYAGGFCHGPCATDRRLRWVVVGGESGPGARPCDVGWIRSVVEQCKAAACPMFVKQVGANPCGQILHPSNEGYGVGPGEVRLQDRKGADPAEWDEELNVREFPEPSR